MIVVNGGMQGLFGSFQSVLNPGDEVLMFAPYWTPIKDLIAFSLGKPVFVPTGEVRERGMEKLLARHSEFVLLHPRSDVGMRFRIDIGIQPKAHRSTNI